MVDLIEAGGADAGLPVYIVDNGSIRLGLLPSVGGRLIALAGGGPELLWRNPDYLDADLAPVIARHEWAPLDGTMGSWANVGGSKTWPAPQGWETRFEWAGPPDPVIDSGAWSLAHRYLDDGSLVVTMRSGADPRTGLRVERELSVPAEGRAFSQRSTFVNVSEDPVEWSIWEVCQVDTEVFKDAPHSDDAGLWVGSTGAAAPLDMFAVVGRIDVEQAKDGRRRVAIDDVVAKVGLTDATGLIEFRRPDGYGVRWRFDVEDAEYPDGGCQVELWMQFPLDEPNQELQGLQPAARLVELEALSPMRALAPGESATFAIEWEVLVP